MDQWIMINGELYNVRYIRRIYKDGTPTYFEIVFDFENGSDRIKCFDTMEERDVHYQKCVNFLFSNPLKITLD